MSLVLLFRNELICDQRCTLNEPHALGTIYNAKKMRIANDNTFAFGVVGPTLTQKEFDVLEAIIREAFKAKNGDSLELVLGHDAWFRAHNGIFIIVMTKRGSYFHRTLRSADPDAIALLEVFNPDIPAGGGTGMHAAALAAREGIPMKRITHVTSKVIYSVGPEYDYVHRDDLQEFTHE